MTKENISVIRLPRGLGVAGLARPALVGEDPVSYGELTRRVDELTRWLCAVTAGPGERVAIWLEKQPRYAEAILATLEAGCVYVPLDGAQPADRVTTILGDSSPTVLFTDRERFRRLTVSELPRSLRTIVLADGAGGAGGTYGADGTAESGTAGAAPAVHTWPHPSAGASADAAPPVGRPGSPDDLAALLYTSGSTGTPKGVKISHRNLANFVGWALEELDVGPADVFANHASFNFDLSTFDLFTALAAGASLWVIPDARSKDVTALASGIRLHGVTVWYSVPSILNLLTTSGALTPGETSTLRYVLFAGEVFPIGQLAQLAEVLQSGTALYNLYGPTETNVCTYHRATPADLRRDHPLPIGTPIKGAHVRVEDEDGNTVTDPGEPGELVVSGECVTPGYWGREHEPAAEDHRRGRHRTGDLVVHEDGLLVYRGRKDRMVKLSGYRVELGEVESAVLRHPAVADAAVIVSGERGRDRIAAYYVLREGAKQPNLLQLKQHCARYLPPYMLPHSATRLTGLPRNANGKTDHRALAAAATPRP
ncbi:amino acid adenylation domain-containing protein [Streptomyces cyaneofuscatus]|uniref:amino acid adenylation domain-containing protein n=1 Tax=Streptomyces cyaneofuscatus TaxID=66883 RepID=UPI0033E46B2E